jgi:hypothetical protein
MDEPFQRIALDFVGPLPMTDSKNRFILVCVDYHNLVNTFTTWLTVHSIQ